MMLSRLPARRRGVAAFGVVALGLLLSGCQTTGITGSNSARAGTGQLLSSSDLSEEQAIAEVQRWSAAYARNEKDKMAAMNFAIALRAAGQTSQAVAVLRKAVIYHPEDREVLAEFGKAQAADGNFEQALATIRRAQRRDNPDWQLLAAEGGILDSLGDHASARTLYKQALVLAPGEPQILNNMALAHMLTGDLDEAERLLRQAAASPKATAKTRENLALVLQLKANPQAASPRTPSSSAGIADARETDAAGQEDTWRQLAEAG